MAARASRSPPEEEYVGVPSALQIEEQKKCENSSMGTKWFGHDHHKSFMDDCTQLLVKYDIKIFISLLSKLDNTKIRWFINNLLVDDYLSSPIMDEILKGLGTNMDRIRMYGKFLDVVNKLYLMITMGQLKSLSAAEVAKVDWLRNKYIKIKSDKLIAKESSADNPMQKLVAQLPNVPKNGAAAAGKGKSKYMSYQSKYLKYKMKYLNLKKLLE